MHHADPDPLKRKLIVGLIWAYGIVLTGLLWLRREVLFSLMHPGNFYLILLLVFGVFITAALIYVYASGAMHGKWLLLKIIGNLFMLAAVASYGLFSLSIEASVLIMLPAPLFWGAALLSLKS